MLLDNRQFFVKERVALLKLTDAYDIYDPETKMQLGIARDEPPGWAKALRLIVSKHFLPTSIHVYEKEGMPALLSLHKKASFLRSTVNLTGNNGKLLGTFRSKLFSLGGGFFVMDALGNTFAEVKGDWKGWNFRFLDTSGRELGIVTKKWAGLGKEMFTTADTYMLEISEFVPPDSSIRQLIMAAVLCIDMVLKE